MLSFCADGNDVASSLMLCVTWRAQTLLGYESLEPGFLAAYPKLNALRSHVTALPSLKAYLDSDRRFPFPSEGALADAYCANVRTVLGR